MKGNILDFMKLAADKPELAQELVELAAKHDFEFSDEVSDEDLEGVAGGATRDQMKASLSREAGRLARPFPTFRTCPGHRGRQYRLVLPCRHLGARSTGPPC
jgi:hypothetical protein